MAYTTPELVAGIAEVDDAISLVPFIDTAHSLVVELCLPVGYTTERLELIERWLAAHFYYIRDQRTSYEQIGTAQARYQGLTKMVLAATTAGQQAMLLDTSGALSALSDQVSSGGPMQVSLTWAGTDRGCSCP